MGETLLHGALASLDSKAQLKLPERGGAGGTAPRSFWWPRTATILTEVSGKKRRLETSCWAYPPVTRTSWEVPDSDFSRSCGDMMLESAREQARALLTRLRIPERLWHLPSATFSGGEQQGVNIARNLSRLVLCCCSTSPPAHWMGPIRRP